MELKNDNPSIGILLCQSKNNGGGVYCEEVLEKIRDIRLSEKV